VTIDVEDGVKLVTGARSSIVTCEELDPVEPLLSVTVIIIVKISVVEEPVDV